MAGGAEPGHDDEASRGRSNGRLIVAYGETVASQVRRRSFRGDRQRRAVECQQDRTGAVDQPLDELRLGRSEVAACRQAARSPDQRGAAGMQQGVLLDLGEVLEAAIAVGARRVGEVAARDGAAGCGTGAGTVGGGDSGTTVSRNQ
jgi:hypothetical protein